MTDWWRVINCDYKWFCSVYNLDGNRKSDQVSWLILATGINQFRLQKHCSQQKYHTASLRFTHLTISYSIMQAIPINAYVCIATNNIGQKYYGSEDQISIEYHCTWTMVQYIATYNWHYGTNGLMCGSNHFRRLLYQDICTAAAFYIQELSYHGMKASNC